MFLDAFFVAGPACPVPVVTLHGTADPFVDYNGGLGPSALALPAPDGSGRTVGDVADPEQDVARLPLLAITALLSVLPTM